MKPHLSAFVKKLFYISAFARIFASCVTPMEESNKIAVTGECSNVTPWTATAYGFCKEYEKVSMPSEYGIEYSATDINTDAVSIKAEEKDNWSIYSCTITELHPNTKYFYRSYILIDGIRYFGEVKTFTTKTFSELADLGLSVKWRSWNLGATKPEEYGGYYQWAGEDDVSDTSIYVDVSNCPYHSGSDWSVGWTKYVSNEEYFYAYPGKPDNKTILDPDDDVAHVKLGDKWRMPTKEDFQELRDNCEILTGVKVNGINGCVLISKINGNSIFLPAAGYRGGDKLYDDTKYGYFWSSSLSAEFPDAAWGLYTLT